MFRATAYAISFIIFIVAAYNTARGVAAMDLLDSGMTGGVIFASALLAFTSLSFIVAMEASGSRRGIAFGLFILFACLNLICNFNALWPPYSGRTTLVQEAEALHIRLDEFKAHATAHLYTEQERTKINTVINKAEAMAQQIREKGWGPEAEKQRRELEQLVGAELHALPSLLNAPNQEHLIKSAEEYKNNVISLAYARLNKPTQVQQSGKIFEIVNTHQENLKAVADELKTNSGELSLQEGKDASSIITAAVSDYNSLCASTKQILGQPEFRCDAQQSTKTRRLPAEAEYHSIAQDYGSLQFTMDSAAQAAGKNKWNLFFVLLICLFIDVLIPVGLYLLGRKRAPEPEAPKARVNNGPVRSIDGL
ncbi:hypothetical protein CO610_09045 [Lysobacteraceae bacterium NML95-0200]|nr:hypothetical protein CO610_09045 [Xanthomonadaceae bacterium NML95-0200]